MINPQLLNYVRAQRQAGVSKEDIIKALAGGGWSAQDAQEAFAALEGVQVPPSAAPNPPLQPAQASQSVSPAVRQPATATSPVQPIEPRSSIRIQPQPVVQPRPVYAQAIPRRRFFPVFLLSLLCTLGGFAGGAYLVLESDNFRSGAERVRDLLLPPMLEPVTEAAEEEPLLKPFAPAPEPLGSDATTGTSTATSSLQ